MIEQAVIEEPSSQLIEAVPAADNKNKLKSRLCRFAIVAGSFAIGAGAGAVVGLETPTHTTLAGNDATAEIELGSNVNEVGLGIFGARIPSKVSAVGFPVGAKVRLDASQTYRSNQVPDEIILPEVLQTFSDVSHETDKITDDIERHIRNFTIGGGLVGAFTAIGGGLTLREFKKARSRMSEDAQKEQLSAYAPIRKYVKIGSIAAITAVSIAPFAYVGAKISRPSPEVHANPLLDETSLEGSEVVGFLAPTIDSAVSWVREYITSTDSFYSELDDNFKQSFEENKGIVDLPAGSDIVPILLVSDRHCNGGMDRIITTAAKLFKAKIIASAGDDYLWGSFDSESVCTSGLAERTRASHIKFVAALGNHDSHTATNPAVKQGITVLDGQPQSINTSNGVISFLSIHDPRRSEFGNGIVPSSESDQASAVINQGELLGEVACENEEPVDILITHDARAATTAINNGCGNIGFAFSGHTHKRKLPQIVKDNVYQYTEGSTGGAISNTPSVGPLQSDADLSVLYFNSSTHQPEGIVYVTAGSDGMVDFSPYFPLGS